MEKKSKKQIWKKWWFWAIAVIIVGVIGSGGSSEDAAKEDNNVAQEAVADGGNTSTETNASEEEAATEDEKEDEVKVEKIKAGTYKVGTDLQAGEYVFFSNGFGYIEVATDSTGSLDSIITNDNVTGHTYITVNDGEYLKMKGGEAYLASEAPSLVPADGIYKDGTYVVGKDIPAGEYKVTVKSAIGMGYLEVSSDSRGVLASIITNENLMEDSYITVEDGQYLKISGAEINVN